MKILASSHCNVIRIINVQIPDQCDKILGGDIDGVVSLTKVETKQTFYKSDSLKEDFKYRFVSSYFINQTLINTRCFKFHGILESFFCQNYIQD